MKNVKESFPDFGPLRDVFESYKASVRHEPLLGKDALERMFAEAPARARAHRILRMKWSAGIASAAIIATALIIAMTHSSPPAVPAVGGAVRVTPVKPFSAASGIKPDSVQGRTVAEPADELQVSDFKLSKYCYDSHLSLNRAVQSDPNLGPGWREATWNDLKTFCTTPERVDTLIQYLRLPQNISSNTPSDCLP